MTDDSSKPKKLSLSGSKLTLGNVDASKLRAGPSVGGTRKTVQVEVRRRRAPAAPQRGGTTAPEPVVTEPAKPPPRKPHRHLPLIIGLQRKNAPRVSAPFKKGLPGPMHQLVGQMF